MQKVGERGLGSPCFSNLINAFSIRCRINVFGTCIIVQVVLRRSQRVGSSYVVGSSIIWSKRKTHAISKPQIASTLNKMGITAI